MILKLDNYKNSLTKVSWLLLSLVFISIPFSPLLTKIALILFVLVTLFTADLTKVNKAFFKDPTIILYFSFYILIAFWAFKSGLGLGLKKLGTQFLFFLLPIIFVFVQFEKKLLINLIKYFVSATIIACVLLYILALIASVENGGHTFLDRLGREQNFFQYTHFTKSLGYHTTYFSMYLTFSILVLFNKGTYVLPRVYKGLIIVFLIVTLLLVNSKMGIISLIAICIIQFTKRYKALGVKTKLLLAITLVIVGYFYFFQSNLSARFSQVISTLNKDFEDAVNVWGPLGHRLKVWYISSEIIKDNWLVGTGTGTVKSSIITYCNNLFESRRCVPIKNFNAHNQFLESFVAYGVSGFIVVILIFLFLFKKGINNPLILEFTTIIFLNCLTESVFERESGVLFFLLISIILILSDNRNETC